MSETAVTLENLEEIAEAFDVFSNDQMAFKRFSKSAKYRNECDIRADTYAQSAEFIRECIAKLTTPPTE